MYYNQKFISYSVDENGYHVSGRCLVAFDLCYFRPTEVEILPGDTTIAREALGRTPNTGI